MPKKKWHALEHSCLYVRRLLRLLLCLQSTYTFQSGTQHHSTLPPRNERLDHFFSLSQDSSFFRNTVSHVQVSGRRSWDIR